MLVGTAAVLKIAKIQGRPKSKKSILVAPSCNQLPRIEMFNV